MSSHNVKGNKKLILFVFISAVLVEKTYLQYFLEAMYISSVYSYWSFSLCSNKYPIVHRRPSVGYALSWIWRSFNSVSELLFPYYTFSLNNKYIYTYTIYIYTILSFSVCEQSVLAAVYNSECETGTKRERERERHGLSSEAKILLRLD